MITRIPRGARMSQTVVANGFVFTAGQVANAPEGASVIEQTRQVLDQVDPLLDAAGWSKRQIVSANIRQDGGACTAGGVVMLGAERRRPPAVVHAADAIPLWKRFAIGCCQCLALVPGVSRSGATIIGAMLLGVERRAAAEFSFFLAMPTMLGAFAYSFWKNREALDFSQLGVIGVGFMAAFAAGLVVVRLFLGIVSKWGFAPFAWYRIVPGAAIFLLAGAGVFGG